MKTNIIFPNKNFIVFDFETSGLDPVANEVIEISAIKYVDGIKQMPFDCLLIPSKPISQTIIDLTKITNKMLDSDGRDPEKVWREFALYIGSYPLIGHNIINFDNNFLHEAFKKYGIETPSISRFVDTAMLYKGRKLEEEQRWNESHYWYCRRVSQIRALGVKFNLVLCCQELGIDISTLQAHRAASDVEMTFQVYKKLMANVEIRTKRPEKEELQKKIVALQKRAHVDKLTDENGQVRVDMKGGD